ncbi:MAG: hypothetical protein KME15_06630 [Drouetiella hepatica Uher 2000/2452]|jgi:hypothetical protein|uniref:Uncharacterized protein n=1 Tax=Drouetiella hepatica Uher 2000/2452 TaxID=904376 RepID=A0A951Q8Z1_9CYAN|nr:hypothetical protein [Drouetiella hepatica Uher 2000/2452]
MKTTSYLSNSPFQTAGNSTSNSAGGSESVTSKIGNLIGNLWNAITVVNVDPQIRQEYDRQGNLQWRVFDPITAKSRFFDSEDDVCAWLEQRYYA